jgi:hypothetical protein
VPTRLRRARHPSVPCLPPATPSSFRRSPSRHLIHIHILNKRLCASTDAEAEATPIPKKKSRRLMSMFGSFSWWCEKRKERREEDRSLCAVYSVPTC